MYEDIPIDAMRSCLSVLKGSVVAMHTGGSNTIAQFLIGMREAEGREPYSETFSGAECAISTIIPLFAGIIIGQCGGDVEEAVKFVEHYENQLQHLEFDKIVSGLGEVSTNE